MLANTGAMVDCSNADQVVTSGHYGGQSGRQDNGTQPKTRQKNTKDGKNYLNTNKWNAVLAIGTKTCTRHQ